jgi:hypothetical protein
MIRFACPRCSAAYCVPDRAAGKKTTCPGCGQKLRVPAPGWAQAVTPRRRGLLLVLAALGSCATAAVSACLLPGCIDQGRLEVAWESWQNHIDRVRRARRTLEELERKHAGKPVERWPADDRAIRAIATHALRELGEEPWSRPLSPVGRA